HGGGDVVRVELRCQPRTAVAELGAGATRFDDRDADAEGRDLLGHRVGEAFDAPLRGVVERAPRPRDLPADRGQLQDPAAATGPQVGQHGTDQLDRTEQVRVDLVPYLLVGQLLGGTHQAVARVAHHHVEPAEVGVRRVDDLPDAGGVGQVEQGRVER